MAKSKSGEFYTFDEVLKQLAIDESRLKRLVAEGEVRAYRFEGKRYDCGHKLGCLQATVELALVLPVVATLLLAVVQVGLVVRDQIRVTHAAREAARAAAARYGARDGFQLDAKAVQ